MGRARRVHTSFGSFFRIGRQNGSHLTLNGGGGTIHKIRNIGLHYGKKISTRAVRSYGPGKAPTKAIYTLIGPPQRPLILTRAASTNDPEKDPILSYRKRTSSFQIIYT